MLFLQTRHTSNSFTTRQKGCSRAPNGPVLPPSSSLNSTACLFDTSTDHRLLLSPPPCSHLSPSLPALGWSPVSPHLTPQHKGYEGVQLHCSLTLELATPPPSPSTPVLRFLSLLCQFYTCYTFAILSFFLFLKYFLFALRPWVSWKVPQLKYIVIVIFLAKAAAIVSSLRFKKKQNFSTNQKKFVFIPKMCNLFTTANPDPKCMALEHICMCARSCCVEDKVSKSANIFIRSSVLISGFSGHSWCFLNRKLRSAASTFSALQLNCFAYQSGNQSYIHSFPVMISSREIDEGHRSIISFNQSAFFPLHAAETVFYSQWRRENVKVLHNVANSQFDSQSCAFPLFTLECFQLTENLFSSSTINCFGMCIQLLLCCSRSQRVMDCI